MKKIYTRFVWWLIGPAVRAELLRRSHIREAGEVNQFRLLVSRNTLNGWARGDELEARLHFWRTIRRGLVDLENHERLTVPRPEVGSQPRVKQP